MRTIHLRSRQVVFAIILGATSGANGCGDPPCSGGDETQVIGPIPTLDVHGVNGVLSGCTGSQCTHEGVFSNGLDLAEPVIPATVPVGGMSWRTNATSTPYASAPNFPTVLDQAVADVESNRLLALDATYLADHLGAIPGITSSVYLPPHTFYEYPAQRGRWLDSEWALPSVGTQEVQTFYDGPDVMAELRRRDIREYCVAREAMFKQNASTTSMGALVGFSFSLFGNPIEVGVVEPTVAIDRPTPFTAAGPGCPFASGCNGSVDATNAFEIPFLFGTRFTLWNGLGTTMSLPEIRYPVIKLAGGSEVRTRAECRYINDTNDFSKEYTTVTQANAIASGAAEVTLGTTIPLFDVGGLMFVSLELGTQLDIGKPELTDGRPSNERLLVPPGPGWPQKTRKGDVGTFPGYPDVNDGYWTVFANPTQSIGTSQTGFTVNATNADPITSALHVDDPFMVRALEDSDERASFLNQLTLSGSVNAGGGLKWGPINIWLQASGTLAGHVGMRHTLTDAAGIDAKGPISSLTVTPSTFASATLGFEVTLHLNVPFAGWGLISVEVPLLALGPYTLASYDTGPWSEVHRLRLGTGSQRGDYLKDRPQVISHFPNPSIEPFESFPKTIDQCLKSIEPNMPPPSECPPVPPAVSVPPHVEPHVELCLYTAYTIGVNNPCNPLELDAYLAEHYPGATAAEKQCLTGKFSYLCDDVSQQQLRDGQSVIAHVLDLADLGEGDALMMTAEACAAVWDGKPEDFAQTFFAIEPCDDAGNLWNPLDVVTGVNPDAPLVTPATCL